MKMDGKINIKIESNLNVEIGSNLNVEMDGVLSLSNKKKKRMDGVEVVRVLR